MIYKTTRNVGFINAETGDNVVSASGRHIVMDDAQHKFTLPESSRFLDAWLIKNDIVTGWWKVLSCEEFEGMDLGPHAE
jgi:hypothetical protein